ncbi:MAG: TlyA family RNA methyltransferase [Peptococcia bacterium]|jgi:23S rRNA (cytidine1920-2'-O)/16S rRNA (cytidine1409-2'-O)-methyltransferase
MGKCRLDQLLVNKGLVPSREKGKALIMAGQVYVDGMKVEKPGTNLNVDVTIEIKGESLPYVSRGGFKLARALQEFKITLSGKVVLDIGASTGGFTDCALQNGATKVYAVDVGYGQLAWSLRQNARVVVMERKNARYLSASDIPEPIDVITIDVAFISLRKIFTPLQALLKEDGFMLALIKPQFEAGREQVGKKGVVKEPVVHCQVIEEIITFSQDLGLTVRGLTYSPIKGPQGNIEFLLWLQKKSYLKENIDEQKMKEKVKKIVIEAHQKL